MRLQAFISHARFVTIVAVLVSLALASCEDDQGPGPAPESLTIVSGDNQYSKKGTELEAPVAVSVTLSDGKPGEGQQINFAVVEGGGTVSRSAVTTNSNGHASVRWTMGPDPGPQRVRATVASNSALTVQIHATSSDYYCPEEDPAFVRKFSPAHDLFLFTKDSELTQSGGLARAGLVQIDPGIPVSFAGVSFTAWDDGAFVNIVRDCAFSANGDFYIAWTTGGAVHEILKIAPDRSTSHFATLQSSFGSEIDVLPGGVLAGCDEVGPFAVGCRDTLTRYPDATFSGVAPDAANNDAVAVDPASGDLYFIYIADRSLRRVPLSGYVQDDVTAEVVTLEVDEAHGARGMVVDDNDGSVYILVESTNTKGIVKVTSAGVKTTEVDFFAARGAGAAAGIQNDLAIDQGIRFLFTLDTLNNVIVYYDIVNQALGAIPSAGGPFDASDNTTDEHVGLAVMP